MQTYSSIFGNFDDLYLFCRVVEEGSASKAAERLGMPISTLSRRLRTLEERLGLTLLQPHKRELVPTPAGERCYRRVEPHLSFIESGVEDLQQAKNRLQGTVRIGCPRAFYYDVVRDVAHSMMRQYPGVTFKCMVHQLPMVPSLESGLDIILGFNDLSEVGDCVARPLYRTKLGIFVHRDYFRDHPVPKSIHELEQLDWVSNYDGVSTIALYSEDVLVGMMDLKFRTVVDDIHAAADEVRAKMGFGFLPIGKARRHPELVHVLPRYNLRIRQAYLVYRAQKFRSRLIEEAADRLEKASDKWYERHSDWPAPQDMPPSVGGDVELRP